MHWSAEIYELKEKMRADLTRRGILPPDAEEIKIGYVEMYLMRHNRAAYGLGLYKTDRSLRHPRDLSAVALAKAEGGDPLPRSDCRQGRH